jgi:FimV-like protein
MSGTASTTAPSLARPQAAIDLDKLDSVDPDKATFEDPTPSVLDGQWHDAATKLDLAKAYQEMGDVEGAREILQEVLHEGDEQRNRKRSRCCRSSAERGPAHRMRGGAKSAAGFFLAAPDAGRGSVPCTSHSASNIGRLHWPAIAGGRPRRRTLERVPCIADAPIGTIAAGRTDTGVHATCRSSTSMVCRCAGERRPWRHPTPAAGHRRAVGAAGARRIPRFLSSARHYTYLLFHRATRPAPSQARRWYHRPLDVGAMWPGGSCVAGTHTSPLPPAP